MDSLLDRYLRGELTLQDIVEAPDDQRRDDFFDYLSGREEMIPLIEASLSKMEKWAIRAFATYACYFHDALDWGDCPEVIEEESFYNWLKRETIDQLIEEDNWSRLSTLIVIDAHLSDPDDDFLPNEQVEASRKRFKSLEWNQTGPLSWRGIYHGALERRD